VFALDPATGSLTTLGAVPQPFHDAAGALLHGSLFIFGGGASTSSSSVQRFDLRTHRSAVVAHLPRPLSDLAAATIGGTVYLVGGYDGTTARREILATTDGLHFHVAGVLPVGLRYAAVAPLGGKLVIAGGAGSDGIYAFAPATGRVTRIGNLPTAIGHASAIAGANAVDVIGGGRVFRIDARGVHVVGTAPAVADAAVAGDYLIGGSRNGHTSASVLVFRGT
jgi:N-acetylneuraminic acid mutarotase